MPELPDVEVYRRRVQRAAVGRRVARAETSAPGMLWRTRPADLRRLAGRTLTGTRRVGKWLFVETDGGGTLVLHFGMTGDVAFPRAGADPAFTRLRLAFDDGGRMAFTDVRRFGEIALVPDADAFLATRRVGPDALALDEAGFLRGLEGRRGGVKALLMGQRLVSGLGNLWVDELLWQVGVHPAARVDRMPAAKRRHLWRVMRRILTKAVEVGDRLDLDWERLPRSYMLRSRRPDGACPRDGRPWSVATVAGRTTYWCAAHQRRAGFK